MRKTIAIDIDGVIANFMEPFTRLCKAHGIKTNNNRYDIVHGCSEEERQTTIGFVDYLLSNQNLVKPYFIDINKTLQNIWVYCDILFLTARRDEFYIKTQNWLASNVCQMVPFDIKTGVKSRNKVQYLLDNNIKILVEDRLRTANEAAEKGIKTFLMKRPWNSNREVHEDIIVIRSLMDILKYIN